MLEESIINRIIGDSTACFSTVQDFYDDTDDSPLYFHFSHLKTLALVIY